MPARSSHHGDMATSRFLPSLFQRRSLMQGLAAGLAVLVAAWLVPHLDRTTRLIIAWDIGLIVFFLSLNRLMMSQTPEDMRAWSLKLRASRNAVLLFTSAAAAAALLTLFVEMKLAKTSHGLAQALRIAFMVASVGLSWFFVQTMFALEYAHEFFAEDKAGKDRGGLAFPGGETPDCWDFLHFSVIIGVAAQTADIAITAKPVRRLVTAHALVAFSFNAVILALTINLAAGVLGT